MVVIGVNVTRISLAHANLIIETALAVARQRGYKAMAVAVLDDAGCLCALQREEGASPFRIDIATSKAWAAVSMGVSSRTLADRAQTNANLFNALPAVSQGKFLPHTGAVVVKGETECIIGAVGASGGSGDEDEAICIAGVEAAGFRYA